MAAPTPPASAATLELIERHLDRAYLVELLLRLAAVPTDVPLGYQTLIEPDDPKLVHYVQEVLRPELVRIGCYDVIEAPRNNLIVAAGPATEDGALLIQNYTPIQHHQHMERPFSPRIASARAYGVEGPAIFAQGVSQNKSHQAVMLAVLKLLRDSGAEPRGRLYWAVNNEGRSSHLCSEAIIGSLDELPTFGILQNRTNLRISLGNRGRLDVHVHVRGKTSHSSMPQNGLNAIEGAAMVISRLQHLTWPDRHPQLGGRQAVVYKVRYEPLAPHTLPSDAYLTVDRRLLPGDDLEQATAEIRAAIGDLAPFEVQVKPGVAMLPALVEPMHTGVQSLQAANSAVRGHAAEMFYGQGTFDAGGPCALGIPTVMFGASGGDWPLGVDFIPIEALITEAKVLAYMILSRG
jgi:acetylornithine deacetylase/succinyl-diaminopimelate desuccinylase-like protein